MLDRRSALKTLLGFPFIKDAKVVDTDKQSIIFTCEDPDYEVDVDSFREHLENAGIDPEKCVLVKGMSVTVVGKE